MKFPTFTLIFTLLLINCLGARLYFIHVPKTGGTTLRMLLEMQLSSDEIFPYRNMNSSKGKPQQQLVSGHFPFWFCKTMDNEFEKAFKVTILRDPVERYLSYLRAKKRRDALPDLESVFQFRLKPHHPYKEELRDNGLCRYYGDKYLIGEALLESAKRSLDSMDCVILFENFNEEVINLFHRLNIEFTQDDIPKMNTTNKENINPQLLEEVRQLHEWDIQLYQYAKENLKKKTNHYSLRTSSYEPLLKKRNHIVYTFDLPLNGQGWSYREKWENSGPTFRKVLDQEAKIIFSLQHGFDYTLHFNAQCSGMPKVIVNGHELLIEKINDDFFSLFSGLIPSQYITSELTEILFSSESEKNFAVSCIEIKEIAIHSHSENNHTRGIDL